MASIRPEERIEYLCDLSKDYYNLLERTVNGETESFVYDNNVISMSKSGNNFYYLQDELGSPMYMTGTDGVVVSSYAFDDFGRNINPFTGKVRNGRNQNASKHAYITNGNIIQPFAFTGYQEDEVSGLKFAQARYYSAEKGRFVGEDQVGGFTESPDTQNKFIYCWNSPIVFNDLNGKWPHDTAHGKDAHRTLQLYLKAENSERIDYELYIPNNVSFNSSDTGRADLVYYNPLTATAEVYEIKPWLASDEGYAEAMGQVGGYVKAMQASTSWKNYASEESQAAAKRTRFVSLGITLKPKIDTLRLPSIDFPDKDIVYKMYSPGIITYNYVNRQQQEEPVVVNSTECEESDSRVGISRNTVIVVGGVVVVLGLATIATILTGGAASWTYAFAL